MNICKALITFGVSIILFVLSVLFPVSVKARIYNTFYWMSNIPQSQYGNPGLFPQAEMYVGLPLISAVYLNVANHGYRIGDLLIPDGNGNHDWDVDHLLGQLKRNNMTQADAHVDLISFGYRHEQTHYALSITDKAKARIGYPPDLVRLATKGGIDFTTGYQTADLNELTLYATHYREISASVTRQWTPTVSAGIRGKILAGLAGAFMETSDLQIRPDPATGDMLVYADMVLNTSGVGDFTAGEEGEMEATIPGTSGGYLTNFKNPGLAFDLGVAYQPSDQLTLAISLLDIGFINWRSQVENFLITESSDFESIDLESLLQGNIVDNITEFTDTFNLDFTRTSQYNSFRQTLPPTVIASVAYDLNETNRLALLTQGMLYEGTLYPAFSFSYHVRPAHMIGLAISYSIVHWNYSNIGFGFDVNIGPLQLYLVGDNILAPLMPHQVQMANIHAGINLLFGQKPAKRTKIPPGLYCW